MNESKLSDILHEIIAELVTNLFITGTHNFANVQEMSDHLHKRIDTVLHTSPVDRPGSVKVD